MAVRYLAAIYAFYAMGGPVQFGDQTTSGLVMQTIDVLGAEPFDSIRAFPSEQQIMNKIRLETRKLRPSDIISGPIPKKSKTKIISTI